ncbi:MAG: dihydrolipoamide acetyltransferase family protein [Pseudomonadota bacterium]
MGEYTIQLPDIGEGMAEAELTELMVSVGDLVAEDDVIAAVMTDKATVEINSVVSGKVVWIAGEIGDVIAIGAPLMKLDVDGEVSTDVAPEIATEAALPPFSPKPASEPEPALSDPPNTTPPSPPPAQAVQRAEGQRPLASPAVRRRAIDAGVDLRAVPGSGPIGQISHEDLDRVLARGGPTAHAVATAPKTGVNEVKIRGLRRKIAERMTLSYSRIPHITIVEEVDVTALEELRQKLNAERSVGKPKLTLLPFLMGAMVAAIREQPEFNAHFHDEEDLLKVHEGVHIGIATQTDNGLMVPVARHCEAGSIWDLATNVSGAADAARDGSASRDQLMGSTITITSLGKLGALATTPIINHPEVAIVGVNKIAVRPVWNGTDFTPRSMMNLSSSFDHRVIDGWDAAIFVQKLKSLLETPAMIFVEM